MPVLTESSQRPMCLPGNKDESFLPRIAQRGSSSDTDSLPENRRLGLNRLPSSSNTSESTSPVKLPAIFGKSKSNSVASFPLGVSPPISKEDRLILCRSPSCPSNIGFWYEQDFELDTPTPEGNGSVRLVSRNSDEFKLPNIKDRNSMCSGASLANGHSMCSDYSPTRNNIYIRENSPLTARRNVSTQQHHDVIDKNTPRADCLDSQRSITQSALLLPIRNSESRLSLKKRKKKNKNRLARQQTEMSVASEAASAGDSFLVGAEPLQNGDYKARTKVGARSCREYFSEKEVRVEDDKFIAKVKEENVVSRRNKDSVVNVGKRHKLKKRMTDNNLYFERELTQVNA